MVKKEKQKEWKEKVLELIREKKNFKSTNSELERLGLEQVAGSTFRRFKQDVFPSELRDSALLKLSERKKDKSETQSTQRTPWSKGKQKEADDSVFAEVLNDAIFYFVPCPQKGLRIEDVREINVGGAIVGLVTYYTSVNLNHPIIIFVSRGIMLVLKIRNMCYTLQEKISEAVEKAKEALPGQGSVHS